MSTIQSALREMFQTTVALPGIVYRVKFRLNIPDSFPADWAIRLRETLSIMLLQENFPPDPTKATVVITPELEDSLVLFHCEQIDSAQNNIGSATLKLMKDSIGDTATDAAWLIYLVTQSLIPMDGGEHVADIHVFSMRQQRAASLIYGALQEHFEGKAKSCTQWFLELSSGYVSSFSGMAPRFDRRPVKQSGWPMVEETLKFKLIKKSNIAQVGMDSLLYDGSFAEEQDQFLEYIKGTPEFQQSISNAIAAAWEKLKHEPYCNIRDALKVASDETDEYIHQQISAINSPINGGSYSSLKPSDISQLFRNETDANYRSVYLKLQKTFIDECCKAMLKQYDKDYPTIIKRLNEGYTEVLHLTNMFEPFTGTLPSWEELSNAPESIIRSSMNVQNYANHFISHNLTINGNKIRWWLSGQIESENDSVIHVNHLNEDILVSVSLN